MWDFVAKNVVDKPDNSNNRFQVAAKMNRLMTDDAYPFWGCPKNAAQKWLSTLKPDSFGDFPEFRLTEDATKALKKTAHAKSLWQMHGAGVVGGQSMLGIAALKTLVADDVRVWPQATGFGALDLEAVQGVSTMIAEVLPPMYDGTALGGEVKDAAMIRLTAEALANADDKGELAAMFAAPKGLDAAQVEIAANEEGWILGSSLPTGALGPAKRGATDGTDEHRF